MTYGLVSGLVVATAVAACGLPAWRAARLDPMRSLR
jgi:ABC-type antimicrobial peptide transport system permease subunit